MKLTERIVKTCPMPAGRTEHVEWDDEIVGFGLRMRRSSPDLTNGRVTRRLVLTWDWYKSDEADNAAEIAGRRRLDFAGNAESQP